MTAGDFLCSLSKFYDRERSSLRVCPHEASLRLATRWTLTLFGVSLAASTPQFSLATPRISTMKAEFQRPKGRKDAIEALNAAIKDTDLTEKTSCVAPAKIVFGSASILLTLIRVWPPFFCQDLLQAHGQPELIADGEWARFCRAWVIHCRCLPSA